MRNILSYLFGITCLVWMLAGCSPEDVRHPSQYGVPKATDMKIDIQVDQETNIVTFRINNPGNNPIWIFDDGKKSTINGCTRLYSTAGTYSVEVKMSNADGISDGSVIQEFTINNTIVDFTPLYKKLAGDETKQWVWDNEADGHLGCGPAGSDGTEWYSAAPNDKAAFGLYDDIFTFGRDMSYVYNPGEGGTVYVNTGCSIYPEYNTTGEDFMVPVEEQATTWDITVEGNDMYLVFPAQTLFGYVPNDYIYNTPKFRILSLTENGLELVADDGTSIAWHYMLKAKVAEKTKADLLARTWVWDNNNQGHLGCGPSGTDGLEWYSAAPNDKANFGLYDDSFVFSLEGDYTYNPGEGGTVYVNAGCTIFPEYNTTGEDFMVPVSTQNATWKLVEEGEDLYLEFPAHTLVGYVPNDNIYNTPRFKVLQLTETVLDMVADDGTIAWHYRFVSEGNQGGDVEEPDEFDEGEDLLPMEYAKGIVGTWTWEPSTRAHFGCGETVDNPTGWWAAGPNDKEGKGLYDDVMTFDKDGTYTFDPGADGLIFVNKGCTLFEGYAPGLVEDYNAVVEKQTTTYTLEQVDGAYYLQFPEGTILSYVSADDLYANPRFKISRMTTTMMELITIQSAIAWKYRFKKISK